MKSNKGKVVIIVIFLVLILLLGGGLFGLKYYVDNTKAVTTDPSQVAFTVEEGESMNKVLDKLYDMKLIKNKTVAQIFVKLNHKNRYYAGNYILNRNMSLEEILNYIGNVKNVVQEQVTVTIAPGYWAKHAAKAIADATNLTQEQILAKWNDIDYIYQLIDEYEFLTEDIFNSERCYLEGYITPETYKFFADTTVEQVTEKLMKQTDKIYQQIKDDIAASKFSVHEIYTLASVILYEANNKADMEMVSSVFYNRFEKGMKMGASSTICYALYNYDKWQDCERNTDIESKYNTYKYPGLPIGPICNATEDALKAAVKPAQSDYYYFIGIPETGECVFARTYDEHRANIKKYLKY